MALAAVSTGINFLQGGISGIKSIFGNNRGEKRAVRDRIKSQLLSIGVNRSAWRNYDSDDRAAGAKLLQYLQSNPAAISRFNRTFNTDINRSNVDSFINAANADLTIGNKLPGMAAVSAGPSFIKPMNVAWILGAAAITAGVYFFQNRKK